MATLENGGELTLRNGFFTGYAVLTVQQFAAGTGLQFRIYRNGVATNLKFVITDHDNMLNPGGTPGGAVKVRGISINPYIIKDDTVTIINAFRSSDKIVAVKEAIELPGYSDATDVTFVDIKLWCNSSNRNIEEGISQGYGGAAGGSGGAGGEGGGIGEDIEVMVADPNIGGGGGIVHTG